MPLSGSPDVLAFDVAPGYRAECLPVAGGAACDPANAAAGEEDTALDRSFTLGTGADLPAGRHRPAAPVQRR